MIPQTKMDFNIVDSIPDLNNYKSFTDRYFSKRYVLNVNGIDNNDIMIMYHSNRITLLSLAPSHFFFRNKNEFKINFNIGNIDRLTNAVKGKSKKGGQLLLPQSVLCRIEFSDGKSFDVISCIKGTLVEVNESLIKNPELLRTHSDSDGFIAIILSSIAISEITKNKMLTHDEYKKIISSSSS